LLLVTTAQTCILVWNHAPATHYLVCHSWFSSWYKSIWLTSCNVSKAHLDMLGHDIDQLQKKIINQTTTV